MVVWDGAGAGAGASSVATAIFCCSSNSGLALAALFVFAVFLVALGGIAQNVKNLTAGALTANNRSRADGLARITNCCPGLTGGDRLIPLELSMAKGTLP
jgi:hypothetical protein